MQKFICSRFTSIIVIMVISSSAENIAQAQEVNTTAKSDWDISIGGGLGIVPNYEGSDDHTIVPVPYINVNWRDTISLGSGGINAHFLKSRNYRAGIGLTYDAGRDEDGNTLFGNSEDDTLRGLGDIDSAPGVRAFASYDFTQATLSSSLTQFFGDDNDGLLIDATLSKRLSAGKKLSFTPSIKATWANDDYMQTFFGITAAQSIRSRFTQFNTESGFKDVSIGLNAMYKIDNNWSVIANTQIKQLLNDAADSPISQQDTNASFVLITIYKF